MATGLITDPIYLQHDTGENHPEAPQRLVAIHDHLRRTGLLADLAVASPTPRPDLSGTITAIHTPAYYNHLKSRAPRSGLVYLDADTPASPDSVAAAERAVSGVMTAIDGVMTGRWQNAFCALRPPGHHAEADRAMGFCLLNNVAIGARYLQTRYHLSHILIVDWDVHHGNGTQHLFYNDPAVFYFSTHQYPFYPGTGAASERGAGAGEGTTLNCPLPAGAGDRELLQAFESALMPAMAQFRPEFILISAGFDAHRDDPLAQISATDDGFSRMTQVVQTLAATYCAGRIVSCLEGGYHLGALARSAERHLRVLLAAPPFPLRSESVGGHDCPVKARRF